MRRGLTDGIGRIFLGCPVIALVVVVHGRSTQHAANVPGSRSVHASDMTVSPPFLVAPAISTVALVPLPRDDCAQFIGPNVVRDRSRVAVISSPTWGCNVDSITVPGSSTLVTSYGHFFHSGRVCLRRRMPGP